MLYSTEEPDPSQILLPLMLYSIEEPDPLQISCAILALQIQNNTGIINNSFSLVMILY